MRADLSNKKVVDYGAAKVRNINLHNRGIERESNVSFLKIYE